MTKTVRDLGKFIVVKGFIKLPKVQKIGQYGHTGYDPNLSNCSSSCNLKFQIMLKVDFEQFKGNCAEKIENS